jgi:CheY-like chemotaxis protein/anti-sigma regulatory factor (Ser/Thr protein kinase)
MSRILVAEDSPTQALQIRLVLEEAGFEVETCADGWEALHSVRDNVPDLVLTDLKMSELDGLELTEKLRSEQPALPVIVISESDRAEAAVQAFYKGAASYVPKRNLERELVNTIDEVLELASAQRHHDWILEHLTHREFQFVLDNNPDLIPPLVEYLLENLRRLKLCDESGLIRIAVAINEALTNAIYHGNLAVGSELRDGDEEGYFELINRRRNEPPYCNRRVYVSAQESGAEAIYTIRDEGAGFNPSDIPDPRAPGNLTKASGRGLLLIRTFMDTVVHNDVGNEIRMIKRRGP